MKFFVAEHLPQPAFDTDSSEGSENAFCDEQCRTFDFETTVIAEQLTLIDAVSMWLNKYAVSI